MKETVLSVVFDNDILEEIEPLITEHYRLLENLRENAKKLHGINVSPTLAIKKAADAVTSTAKSVF